MRSICLAVIGLFGACAPAAPREEAVAPAETQSFEATVQIDAEPGGKRFQGVWLLRDDGARWVIAYRPEPWLVPFADRRVRVTGERYEPEGQAILSPHLRVDSLRLLDAGQATAGSISAIGPEQALTGRFAARVGEPGSKLEGEAYRVFVDDDGRSYLLAHEPPGVVLEAPVKIRARDVEASPYVAARGGPTLWVLTMESLEAGLQDRSAR